MSQLIVGDFFHAGVIPRDARLMASMYWKALGVGPWWVGPLNSKETGDLYLDGQPLETLRMDTAHGAIGSLALALDQPLSGQHPYEAFLAGRSQGVHHLAFIVPSMAAAKESMASFGYAPVFEARNMGLERDGAAAYFDTTQSLGVVVELVEMPSGMPPMTERVPAAESAVSPSTVKLQGAVHVALATRDAEAMAKQWQQLLGVGPWTMSDFGEGVEMRVGGEPTAAVIHGAQALLSTPSGPLALVLEQPLTVPQPLNDFIEIYGPGVHHFCLAVEDLDQASVAMGMSGYRLTYEARGFGPNGDGAAAHFDTTEDLGVVLELAKPPTEPQRRA